MTISSSISAAAAAQRENARQADGKFGEQAHTETGNRGQLELTGGRRKDWGDVSHIQAGSRTPWGAAQHVDYPADGIAVVSCAGHGGVKLSPQRNATVPPPLRRHSGWYEEDAEAHIVGMCHPEVWSHLDRSPEQIRAEEADSVAYWFTDEYELATGEMVPIEKSNSKQRLATEQNAEQFRAEHADEFVSFDGGHNSYLPTGYSLVEAERRTTGEKRLFMVRSGFFDGDRVDRPRLVDPKQHLDVTEAFSDEGLNRPRDADSDVPTLHKVPVNLDRLTAKQRERAEAELSKRYRDSDGEILTMPQFWEKHGVTGKRAILYGGDRSVTYYVTDRTRSVFKVSKAAWDALDLPDLNTDEDRASMKLTAAQNRHLEAINRDEWRPERRRALREALDKAQAEYAATRQPTLDAWDAYRAAKQKRVDAFLFDHGFSV